jgi:hypothetical protein
MSVLLAIEPDRRQAAKLTALARGPLQVEVVIGETTESAFEALGARVPDLVLTSLLLSRKDESALADRLRELDAAGRHVQTLVIPVLGGSAEAEGKRSKGFFGRLLRSNAKATTDGCDPAVFGDQIREYLERAAADRAAKVAAQADLDAAWSEQPPPADDVTQSFVVPPQPAYQEPAYDETVKPSWESTPGATSSWESSSAPASSWESPSSTASSWESTSSTKSSWENPSSATDYTPDVPFDSGPVAVESRSFAGDSNDPPGAPDLAEELRAHLSSVVEPETPFESSNEPVLTAAEPTPAVAAWEPQPAEVPPADPFVEAVPATMFASTPAPVQPEVQEEEWEEISLEITGDQEAPSEIVSEVIDLEALMRELHAVESEGEEELPPSNDHVGPLSIVADEEPAAALSATDFGPAAAPPVPSVAPSVISFPEPTPASRPSLDLETFAAELKLAATPVGPEPRPEPPAPLPSSASQSGWRDVLSAIRRDIDQLRDEKPAPPAPAQSGRDRSFEPLVFPARPAPAAEALSRIEPPPPARVEPPPPAPAAPPVLAQLEEAVQSVLKPLVKKSRETAAPPAVERVAPTPDPPTPVIATAPAVEITRPVIADVVRPVVAEVALPVVADVTLPVVAQITPPIVLENAPPVVAAAAPFVVPEITPRVDPPSVPVTESSPAVAAPSSVFVSSASPVEAVPPPVVIEKAVTPPAATVPPPALEVAPVVERPAPKPVPSPLELLSSLGLEPVDVLVPEPVPPVDPEPVIESPAEISSAATELHDSDAALVEPASRRSSKSKKKRRHEQARPAAKSPQIDDWGFFDPQKVGFATLLSKLNEVADRGERAALPRR